MADLSLADIMAVSGKDKDSLGGAGWLILLFIFIFAIFGNGFSGFGAGRGVPYGAGYADGNLVTQTEMQNALNYQSTAGTLGDIRTAQCENTRFLYEQSSANLLATRDASYQNLLGVKDIENQMAQCCCDIKQEVLAQNQITRDLINQINLNRLQTELSDAKAEISNQRQSADILNTIGQWRAYPPVNPFTCYGCGCGNNNF